MKTFWRPHKLQEGERILLNHLFDAHNSAVFRHNISSEVLKAAFYGNNGDFTKAAAAALCSLGGVHAPIVQAYELLEADWPKQAWPQWDGKSKIPGWGSSFTKGKPDPYVDNVLIYIGTGWEWMLRRINNVTENLHLRGKHVFPNMACATAATGVILGLPKELTPALLLHGRALAWAELLYASDPKNHTEG
jgi:hypothetical protein